MLQRRALWLARIRCGFGWQPRRSIVTSQVYLIPAEFSESAESLIGKQRRLFDAAGMAKVVAPKDLIAVKTHFGEAGNVTHLQAKHVRGFVDAVHEHGGRAFLTETSTLYVGRRSNAVDHVLLAHEHGFTVEQAGCPLIMADGLMGNSELTVPAPGTELGEVALAEGAVRAQGMIVVSHVTGHCGAGLGATIKNVGMGCSSRKGKMLQHSTVTPTIDPEKCTYCKVCMDWCPTNAISGDDALGAAVIDQDLCIGCGECLSVCRVNAVKFNWAVESADMQRMMTAHTLGLHLQKRGRIAYVSWLVNVSGECDCLGQKLDVIGPDVGILASFDPVALDQAALDVFEQRAGETLMDRCHPHLDPTVILSYGEEIGLGSRTYDLVELEG